MRSIRTVVAVVGLFAGGAVAHAAARGTPAEAKAMLGKAVAHVKSAGRAQAYADFTARKPPFFDRDLYVFCLGGDQRVAAHGGFPNYVGASIGVLKDADGKVLAESIWNAVNKGNGEVRYPMLNPMTHKLEHKIGFFQKVGDDVCGVGAYSP